MKIKNIILISFLGLLFSCGKSGGVAPSTSSSNSSTTSSTSGTTENCDGSTTIGHTCSDGGIYSGTYNGYKYMTTISNCTNSTCTNGGVGGTDSWSGAWGTEGVTTNATSTSDGNTNSSTIIASDSPTAAAAIFCGNLIYGGHSDWFLPSDDELNLLYTNKVAIGGFDTTGIIYYWSSTETGSTNGSIIRFTDGLQADFGKSALNRLRCTRKY